MSDMPLSLLRNFH